MKSGIGIKFLLAIVLISGFFFIFYKSAFAQGTFSCEVSVASGKVYCGNTGTNNCSSGFVPRDCHIWNGSAANCKLTHECITNDLSSSCTQRIVDWILLPCRGDFPNACFNGYMCCKTKENCDELPLDNAFSFCNGDQKCLDCSNGTGEFRGKGIGSWTAIGCIPTSDLNSFAGWIFPKVIGIASGIAFLLMVLGTFQIITSSGDPKKKQAGSELITSALSGLLFIILSIFLLKLIGVDILRIPGFSS